MRDERQSAIQEARILGIRTPWEVSGIEPDLKAGEVKAKYIWSKSRGPSRPVLNAGPVALVTTGVVGSGGIWTSASSRRA